MARQPAQMKAPPSFSERLLEVYQPPFQPSSTPSHLQNRFMVRIIPPLLTSSSPHTLPPSPSLSPVMPSSLHLSHFLSVFSSLSHSSTTSPLHHLTPPPPHPSTTSLLHHLTPPPPHSSTISPLHRYTIWWVWFVAMAMRRPQWWKSSSTIRAHTMPSACPIPLASPWQP